MQKGALHHHLETRMNIIKTTAAAALIGASATLAHAGKWGNYTPEEERIYQEVYQKGEEFGQYLITKFEAKNDGKSRKQNMLEAQGGRHACRRN
jgi:hypothetical protein